MEAGIPRDVTLAPRVAVVAVTPEEVGEVTVGTAGAASVVKIPSAEYPVPVAFVAYPR